MSAAAVELAIAFQGELCELVPGFVAHGVGYIVIRQDFVDEDLELIACSGCHDQCHFFD